MKENNAFSSNRTLNLTIYRLNRDLNKDRNSVLKNWPKLLRSLEANFN